MSERMQILVGFGLCGLVGLKVLPHTLFLQRYRDFFQQYSSDGSKTQLDSSVEELTEKVFDEAHFSSVNKVNIEYFTSYVIDPVHMGSFNLNTGALIGIPKYFAYKELSDVEREKLAVRTQPIDWNSDKGHDLEQSMVLSEKAKKFAIARELFHVKSNYVFMDAFITTGSLFLAYFCSVTTTNVLKMRSRVTPSLKFTIYTFYFSVMGVLYLLLKDSYNNYLDIACDKNAAAVGRDYLEGGVEFYEKILLRNASLRELLPNEEGKSSYTSFGNKNELIRNTHFPITGRHDKLKKMLEDSAAEPE